MPVTVRLFAIARQRVGRASVVLDLPEPVTVGDLRRALAAEHPTLASLVPSLLIAVGFDHADDDQPIFSGADIAVIPVASGGAPRRLTFPDAERSDR